MSYSLEHIFMENRMLDYSISKPEGILEMTPDAPLGKEDFERLSQAVDSYLADHTKLRGVLIHAVGFPGWEDFGALAAHMQFVGRHHKSVERVAIASDSHFAGIAATLGKYFTSAEIKQFSFADDEKALHWLEDKEQLSPIVKEARATP
jgi:hypothetical protein